MRVLICLILVVGSTTTTMAKPPSFDKLSREFDQRVQPILKRYCNNCHSPKELKGDLNLQRFGKLAAVRKDPKVWLKVVEMLDLGEMPPEKSAQPSAKQKQFLRSWAIRYLRAESLANAGDPGPVVLRRLNNAEYTYTIRDLTGVKLDPAKELPTAGAAGEGFTNVGNALVMSPALLRKYIDAGKGVAAHAVLLPNGFRFSKYRTRRDWTDEILVRIRRFYARYSRNERLGSVHGHPTLTALGGTGRIPLNRYLTATVVEREAIPTALQQVAQKQKLNTKYLRLLWRELNRQEKQGRQSFMSDLRYRWQSAQKKDVAQLVTYIQQWQGGLWTINPVGLIGRKGSPKQWLEPIDPLVASHTLRIRVPTPPKGKAAKPFKLSFVTLAAGDGAKNDYVVWKKPRLIIKGKPDVSLKSVLKGRAKLKGNARLKGRAKLPLSRKAPTINRLQLKHTMFGMHPDNRKAKVDADSLCVRAPTIVSVEIPAAYAGRDFVVTAELHSVTGKEGSAQVDLIAGVPKAMDHLPAPVVKVVLKKVNIGADQRTVEFTRPILVHPKSHARKRLLAAIAEHRRVFPAAICYTQIVPADEFLTLRLLHRDDQHLQRLMLNKQEIADINRMWDELRYVSLEPLRLSDVLDSMLETTKDHPQEGFFDSLVKPVRKRAAEFRKLLVKTETNHLRQLVSLANQAWRRPLTKVEATELRGLYNKLRSLDLPHEEAFRLTMARVFVAAPFLYKLESPPARQAPSLVSQWELANRLSYFLWSSMPDNKLRLAAKQDKLKTADQLIAHTRRMLKDPRVRRLAVEFGCQYLHIHDFPLERKSSKHFPQFNKLKHDMYEESILFLTDVFQKDASVLSLLSADHLFVNNSLAKLYQIPNIKSKGFVRVDRAGRFQRGGILAQASLLAKQSGATRTSPILRGNWVSEVLLGEKLPKPPKNVPQLADEVPKGLTERQLIERHSKDPSCAKCHRRIDPFGFAMEGYDAIGRARKRSSAGGTIGTKTILPDGTKIEGLTGLRKYLLSKRRNDVLKQFCRKLLGYALGRQLQLSDQPLVETMMQRLEKNDFRVSVAVESIVTSKQFLMIRGRMHSR